MMKKKWKIESQKIKKNSWNNISFFPFVDKFNTIPLKSEGKIIPSIVWCHRKSLLILVIGINFGVFEKTNRKSEEDYYQTQARAKEKAWNSFPISLSKKLSNKNTFCLNQIMIVQKILILGCPKVGKSSVCVRFTSNSFSDDYKPTLEDSYRKKMLVHGKQVVIEIVDVGNGDQFFSLKDLYINDAAAFVLIYGVDDRESFDKLEHIREQILESKQKQKKKPFLEKAKFIIVVNKKKNSQGAERSSHHTSGEQEWFRR